MDFDETSKSISKLSASSKNIPIGKEFHFYNNFSEFKAPVKLIDQNSEQILVKIGSSNELFGKKGLEFGDECRDMETEAFDWLVNVNDEIIERIDVEIDEFCSLRKKEEESGGRGGGGVVDEEGFEVVCGKKKKKNRKIEESRGGGGGGGGEKSLEGEGEGEGKVRVKQKVRFHIGSIRRPQEEYGIVVDNGKERFGHVWLERSEEGIPIHPLEKFSSSDFVDRNDIQIDPIEPSSLECTPFKIVEEVKDLKELAAKLQNVNEFAVDLEHNQYRSFQGLTCLMQISTRNEDFIIDTLKLHIYIGPYLREVFKDPTKRKVMHGADRDVLWLQRDFGIYICNMFDTGQASKVLNLERNSLEYLLNHFCGVQANKEYQNADWRLRPLPEEMQKYAREDTHYLLYIYDLMRKELLSLYAKSDCPGASLLDVYTRSYSVCMLLYEKDLPTDSSFRNVYGVPGAGLSAEQLAVVSALCEWRDTVGRSEDESTGFILPNRTLVEIAKEVPLTTAKLRRLVRSKHPYVERNLNSVVSIIKNAILNSTAFEAAAEELKVNPKGAEKNPATTEDEVFPESDNVESSTPSKVQSDAANYPEKRLLVDPHENGHVKSVIDGSETTTPKLVTNAVANVEVLKKPGRAFGSLLGNSSKRKLLPDKREPEQMKLEQIKSAVNLPFLPFVNLVKPDLPLERSVPEEAVPPPATSSKAEDIILLNSEEELQNGVSEPVEESTDQAEDTGPSTGSALNNEEEDDPMTLSDLSSNFQKCFPSINQSRRGDRNQPEKSQGHQGGLLKLKPFDYEAAREQVIFGKASRREEDGGDGKGRKGKTQNKKPSSAVKSKLDDAAQELPQGKRRQAFPASGNRSSTFRQ